MRIRPTLAALLIAAVGLLAGPACADEPGAPDEAAGGKQRVLLIGNSYAQMTRPMLEGLFRAGGGRYELTAHTPGGRRLVQHLADAHVAQLLERGGWSHVVLQEQSQTPAYGNLRPSYLKGLKGLAEKARAKGAKPLAFTTWGRRDGDRHNPRVAPDYATMQRMLDAGFAEAEEAGVPLAPVHRAWRGVMTAGQGQALYAGDGSHPSRQGAYLAACVLYRAITGSGPPAGFTGGLGEPDARRLRAAAEAAFAGEGEAGDDGAGTGR